MANNLYNSREVFERKYICRDYEINEIIEPTVITGDSLSCVTTNGFLTGELLAQSQDGVTYPLQEIYKIVFGSGASATITKDANGGVLNLHIDNFTYSTFLANNGSNSNVGQIGNFFDAQVSQPDSEGVPYKIGSYNPGDTVQTAISDVTINHTSKVRYKSGDIFRVTVYDADGVTILDDIQRGLSNLNINTTTLEGTTISLQNIESDVDQFAGEFSAVIQPSVLLGGNSGRLTVAFNISGQVYINSFFYDSQTLPATLTSNSLTIENGTIKTLSGISFYSALTLDLEVIFNDTNYHTWRRPFLEVRYTDLNMPELNIDDQTDPSQLSWTDFYNENGSIYRNTGWTIPVEQSLYNFSNNSLFLVRVYNTKNTVSNSLSTVLNNVFVDTRTRVSTDTIERFGTELYRVSQSADFDQPNQKSWDSTASVLATDAKVFNLGVEHSQINYTTYVPTPQFDYSSHTGNQVFIREFITTGTAHASFTLNVTGTFTLMEYKLAKAWDGTTNGGTVWVRGDQPFNLANWNSGNPDVGFGGSLGGNIYSFGNNNIINTNDTMYIRFTFAPGQRITSLSVVFN